MRSRRYLWAYSATDERRRSWNERFARRCRERGYDVTTFCVTPPSVSSGWLPFPELHRRWREGDRELLDLYWRLDRALEDRDVFVLFNGAHIHPEFATSIDAITVYHCADDPESTEILSKPAAPAFDISLVANVACVDMYRSWGVRSAHFLPLGSQVFSEDVADLTPRRVREDPRPVPLFLACERVSSRRHERLDALEDAFPEATFVGRGWPNAYLPWNELWVTYRRTQIGWNIHNSVGPVNFRTYDLPAFGVLQICDNRERLGELYQLGQEVVGFDTIDECIEKTRYYIRHTDEQRAIAAAGRERWERDYTPDAVWDRLVRIVEEHVDEPLASSDASASTHALLARRRRLAVVWRILNRLRDVLRGLRFAVSVVWSTVRGRRHRR